MANSKDNTIEFRQCIEKLYSSIVILRQYLSRFDQQTFETCIDNEESEEKFRVSTMLMYSSERLSVID